MKTRYDQTKYDLKDFLNRYKISICESKDFFVHDYEKLSFKNLYDTPRYETLTTKVSRLLTITIPETELENLYNMETVNYRLRDKNTELLTEENSRIQKDKDEEKIRNKYRAVQEAYEHYKILLNLNKE
jgi:hypothetical protein